MSLTSVTAAEEVSLERIRLYYRAKATWHMAFDYSPLDSLSQFTTGKPQGEKGLVLSVLSLCTDPRSDALIRAAR